VNLSRIKHIETMGADVDNNCLLALRGMKGRRCSCEMLVAVVFDGHPSSSASVRLTILKDLSDQPVPIECNRRRRPVPL
jgi:hypothetical protein